MTRGCVLLTRKATEGALCNQSPLHSSLQCSYFLSTSANHCPTGLHLHGTAMASSWIWLSSITTTHSALAMGVLVRQEGDRWHLCYLPYHPQVRRCCCGDRTTHRYRRSRAKFPASSSGVPASCYKVACSSPKESSALTREGPWAGSSAILPLLT